MADDGAINVPPLDVVTLEPVLLFSVLEVQVGFDVIISTGWIPSADGGVDEPSRLIGI